MASTTYSRDDTPAFPTDAQRLMDGTWRGQPGMSLRDWYVGQALAGLVANANLMDHLNAGDEIHDAAFADSVVAGARAVADAVMRAKAKAP